MKLRIGGRRYAGVDGSVAPSRPHHEPGPADRVRPGHRARRALVGNSRCRRAGSTSASRSRAASASTRCRSCSTPTSASARCSRLRVLHSPVVFMLGPEANHFVTVSNASKFRWRDGSMGDLIPLLGDGLLTIDGPYHRQSRKVMLPVLPPRADRADGGHHGRGDRARARLLDGRPAGRPLPLDPRPGPADRDARAARLRRRPWRGPPCRRGVRGGARLLGTRLPAPDGARPVLALLADAAAQAAARRARLRGDRAAPGERGAPRRPDERPARGHGRRRRAAVRPRGARPPRHPSVRRPRHHDLDGRVPLPRAAARTRRSREGDRGGGHRAGGAPARAPRI